MSDEPTAYTFRGVSSESGTRGMLIEALMPGLREPFPDSQVGKLPRARSKNAQDGVCLPADQGGNAPPGQDFYCGKWHKLPAVHLDYVGHAAVTIRLLEVDPEWSWEPVEAEESGKPIFELSGGRPVGLWIRLTVGGVTRLGYGSCGSQQNDPEKVLIGDALRNAAMRFGVATDLWVKGHEEEHDSDEASTPDRGRPAPPKPQPEVQEYEHAPDDVKEELRTAIAALNPEMRRGLAAEWLVLTRNREMRPLGALAADEVDRARALVRGWSEMNPDPALPGDEPVDPAEEEAAQPVPVDVVRRCEECGTERPWDAIDSHDPKWHTATCSERSF